MQNLLLLKKSISRLLLSLIWLPTFLKTTWSKFSPTLAKFNHLESENLNTSQPNPNSTGMPWSISTNKKTHKPLFSTWIKVGLMAFKSRSRWTTKIRKTKATEKNSHKPTKDQTETIMSRIKIPKTTPKAIPKTIKMTSLCQKFSQEKKIDLIKNPLKNIRIKNK